MGWAAATLVVLVALAGAVFLAVRKGRSDANVDAAEARTAEAQAQAERMALPMPSTRVRARAALRELKRRGVRVAHLETPVRSAKQRSSEGDPERRS
jgi:type VI protein secretion system component VasK